ncbi:MAG: HAMP domain-containing protein [Deltaproteobacteria bacterium]|nr:HAMP domain-containing protein [Deltaproteobacteria bacterium]
MWGIKTQLIAGIAIITVAAITLLGFLSIKMLEWNALYRKGKEAEVIAAAIHAYIGEGQAAEAAGLKKFVAALSEKGVIKDMAVVDDKGKIWFVIGEGLPVNKDEGDSLYLIKDLNIKMVGGGWFSGVGKELLVVSAIKGSASGGFMMFSMPLWDIRKEAANFRTLLLFYAIFDSVIIIAVGAYFFSKNIIRPMSLLKETAENIAGGMLEQRVNIHAKNEIGSFAASFNTMADRLEEKIRTLERVNKELVAAQEELVRSEKLATVGRLASGIAHEIGNPLGAMLGYVDILKKTINSKKEAVSSEEKEILERLGKEIERIDKIVRGLLDFSRPSVQVSGTKGVLQDIDVNKAVNDSVQMFLPQFSGSGILFDMRLSEILPHILMDEGMLHQVLLNLFLNAKDAMAGGGTITVETGVRCQASGVRVKRRKDDLTGYDFTAERKETAEQKFVVISVADTGKGIAQEDIGRIFDPFFTTKELGKGTGLGLAVSLGIVQTFGGDIKVKSKAGEGATFEVFLPI